MIPSFLLKEALVDHHTYYVGWDCLRVVQEPVEQGRGQHLVSQQISPVRKAGIGGQNNRPVLVASGDQLEEVVSLFLREFGVTHFIDDQQTGRDVATQTLAHEARMRGTLQDLCQLCQGGKEHRMSGGECPVRQGQAQMRFSCAGRAEEDDVGACSHE